MFSLACCLYIVCQLIAQAGGGDSGWVQDDPPSPFGRPALDCRMPPPAVPLPVQEMLPVKLPQLQEREEDSETFTAYSRWVLPIITALIASLGGFGMRPTPREQAVPKADAPTTRLKELGLGVNGKGGVWRRQVHPWEE
jgi:hypothetical protein